MGNRGSKFGGGSDFGIGDIETLRERVLDHAEAEDAIDGLFESLGEVAQVIEFLLCVTEILDIYAALVQLCQVVGGIVQDDRGITVEA